jgi:hypothetical protein
VIRYLSDEHHERLWRICDSLVTGAGARSALLCDESTGAILVSVGDASASGSVSSSQVQRLSPKEFAVAGEAGQIYGVNIPGGAILAVLHDAGLLEQVRAVAAEAVHDVAELLASLPTPPPEPAHGHVHAPASASPKPKETPARKKIQRRPPVKANAKRASQKPPPRKPPKPARKPLPKTKRALGVKPKARSKSKPKKRR